MQIEYDVQNEYDAIVVGGNFAGLSAAMQLARARRKVLVLDTIKPRNRFSHAVHGFLGQDGKAPEEIMDIARRQVLAYPTAEFQQAEAIDAAHEDGIFSVTLADHSKARAERLILATGMTDHLPDVPGMQALWGTGVLHCPYCHGYEVAGRKFAVYGVGPMSVHQAALVRDWSDDVTLLTGGGDWLTPQNRDMLTERGVTIEEAPVLRLIAKDRELEAVEFADGRIVPFGAMFTAARASFASPLAEKLGCEIEQTPFGPAVKVDAMKETTVPGVFAAGDMASPMYNATLASSSGVLAGGAAHQSLLGLKMPASAGSSAAQAQTDAQAQTNAQAQEVQGE